MKKIIINAIIKDEGYWIMKKMNKIFLSILILLSVQLINSCCTKKQLVCPEPELILILNEDYSKAANNFMLYITEKGNVNKIIDSTIILFEYDYIFSLKTQKWITHLNDYIVSNHGMKNRELHDVDLIIQSKIYNISDTLTDISYEYQDQHVKGNNCVLYTEMETCTIYKDFSLKINGKIFNSSFPEYEIKP